MDGRLVPRARILFPLLAAVLTLALSVPQASAAIYVWDFGNPPAQGPTIQDLLDTYEGQMQVGDKVFSFFNDSVTTTASVGAVAPGPVEIRLAGVQILGDYGLRFNGGWSAGGQEIADTTILFSVEIAEPQLSSGYLIKDNSLWISAFGISGTGDGGIVSVSENVYAQNPRTLPPNLNPPIANKFVYYRSSGDQQLYDEQDFDNPLGDDQLPKIWVLKDIIANGGTLETGSAHLSEFYQTFSQVPEPATLALLGLGGMALAGRGLRRKRIR